MTNHAQERDWAQLYARHLDEWNERLASALAATGFDGLVIFAGNELTRFRDDQTYPFFVEAYFKAWVPLADSPGSVLKLVPGEKPLLILLREQDFWHASVDAPTGYWVEHFDIREAASAAGVRKELGSVDSNLSILAESPPEMGSAASQNHGGLLSYLDYFRALKTDYEVACIERANEIAALGHAAAQEAFRNGASEFGINSAYCLATQQTDEDLPYPNIVAVNEHAATLHYQKLQRDTPAKLRSFLLDAGAQYNGYASDVSRTCSGDEPAFESLIESMDGLQQAICAEVKSGTDFVALHNRAHELLADVLTEHLLLDCTSDEAYSTGMTRTFLPHGLGHLLGLQVHDVGGRQSNVSGELRDPPAEHPMLRLTRVLEPGFVVTIEPGLYFIPSLLKELRQSPLGRSADWDKLEALQSCGGIRVEDNVLVTSTGARNITRSALETA
ncbi:MAG: Xaa-Pro dipeptidase [Candidatus Rariloculaceae bacterium]